MKSNKKMDTSSPAYRNVVETLLGKKVEFGPIDSEGKFTATIYHKRTGPANVYEDDYTGSRYEPPHHTTVSTHKVKGPPKVYQ